MVVFFLSLLSILIETFLQFRLERIDSGSVSSVSYKLVSLVRFDRERTDSVDLTIECADGGSPRRETRHSVKVEILDKNDERPIFRKSHYVFNVSENMPRNTVVGKLGETGRRKL